MTRPATSAETAGQPEATPLEARLVDITTLGVDAIVNAANTALTPGFRLPARHVIHAVGPVWHGGGRGEAALLASAYRAAMAIAREHGLRSIAFPAISTGIYGYPLEAATRVAVDAVRDELEAPGSPSQVVFACFNREALEAYARAGVAGGGHDA